MVDKWIHSNCISTFIRLPEPHQSHSRRHSGHGTWEWTDQELVNQRACGTHPQNGTAAWSCFTTLELSHKDVESLDSAPSNYHCSNYIPHPSTQDNYCFISIPTKISHYWSHKLASPKVMLESGIFSSYHKGLPSITWPRADTPLQLLPPAQHEAQAITVEVGRRWSFNYHPLDQLN